MSEMVLDLEQARRHAHRKGRSSNTFPPLPDGQRTLVGTSFAIRRVHEILSRAALANSTVLICGETGTGKELAARYIHQASRGVDAPFLAIDCAALTGTLLESELFGRRTGALTGARMPGKSKFELARGGTLFLDEIGALAPPLQARLLRVLEERRLGWVSGLRPGRIDVRLIAAANTDLEAAARRGAFRSDLYYRLKVVSVTMPPLRERPEDILPLVDLFVHQFGWRRGRRVTGVSPEALSLLMRYHWPGNVRELRNAIEHACVTGTFNVILPRDLPDDILRGPGRIASSRPWLQTDAWYGAARDCAPHDPSAMPARKGLGAIIQGTVPCAAGWRLESAPLAARPSDMTGRVISRYRILEKLGEGGMGAVYKAIDARLGRMVALKFLAGSALAGKDEKARFLRGAMAAAAVNHPNICTIYDLGQAHGQPFIVMEYVAGEVLRKRTRRAPLALDDALRLAIDIGRGLQAAHNQGIVHRDIKTSNIMVTPDGLPKIMDFGLAQPADRTQITRAGTLLGTPAYMSPEQARGMRADRRSDLWSLGVVLYEMVTGRLPFRCDSEAAAVHSILHHAPEPVTALRPGLPPELSQLIAKALAKCPAERYQRVDDLLADLRAIRDRLPPQEPAPPAAAPAWQPKEPYARTVTLDSGLRKAPCLATQTSAGLEDPTSPVVRKWSTTGGASG